MSNNMDKKVTKKDDNFKWKKFFRQLMFWILLFLGAIYVNVT